MNTCFMYSNSGKMHHMYTPRYIKRIRGAKDSKKHTEKHSHSTVTFFWGVYSIEETSLCTGESQIIGPIFLCQLV